MNMQDDSDNITGIAVTISDTGLTGYADVDVEIDEYSLLSWSYHGVSSPTQTSVFPSFCFEQAYLTDTVAIAGFTATAVGPDRIDVAWTDGNNPVDSPDIYIEIRHKTGGYPNTPPAADSTQIYYHQTVNGACTYSDIGLDANTTYFYRIWRKDIVTGAFILDGEDSATTTDVAIRITKMWVTVEGESSSDVQGDFSWKMILILPIVMLIAIIYAAFKIATGRGKGQQGGGE
jgi:hypothetical protein